MGVTLVPYTDPQSATEWLKTSSERAKDGSTLSTSSREIAAQYFYGFSLECAAKALFKASNPTKKIFGHNVFEILDKAHFSRLSVSEEWRLAAENRDVSIRYQHSKPSDFSPEATEHLRLFTESVQQKARRKIKKINARENQRKAHGK